MIRFILLILLFLFFYFLFKIILQFIIPFFRARNNFSSQNSRKYSNKKEGETTIDYIPKKDKKFKKEDGEYVNYKDVKE